MDETVIAQIGIMTEQFPNAKIISVQKCNKNYHIINSDNMRDKIKSIADECRKGRFLYVQCEKKFYPKVRKLLMEFLSYKRGIFTWKGIVILSKQPNVFTNYFDKEIILSGR